MPYALHYRGTTHQVGEWPVMRMNGFSICSEHFFFFFLMSAYPVGDVCYVLGTDLNFYYHNFIVFPSCGEFCCDV